MQECNPYRHQARQTGAKTAGLDIAGLDVFGGRNFHLTASFQDNPRKPAPERQNRSGF